MKLLKVRSRRKVFLLAAVFLLITVSLGINLFLTRVLPYYSQYNMQVVLAPGAEPISWECLYKVYGHDANDIKGRKVLSNRNRKLKSTAYRVPNFVHFVSFGNNRTFTFVNYLSVLGAYKVQKPDRLLMHYDFLPTGAWWERVKEDVPTLELVKRERPKEIGGRPVDVIFHASDIARLEILLDYGGVYIDSDALFIQEVDDLRHYPCTLGKEKPPKFISGFIVAEKGALFLQLWLETYKYNYVGHLWDYNSASIPYHIYNKHPKLLHVEPWRITTPDWTEREQLLLDNIEWRKLYLLHLMWHGQNQTLITPEIIKTMPGILGSVTRNLYYGSPDKIA